MTDMLRLVLATFLALPAPTLAAQEPATDHTDAVTLLQGTSTDGRLPPAEIARVQSWIGRIREAHEEVASIHASPRHEPGAAILFFESDVERKVAGADWRLESGRLMQDGPLGVPEFDALQEELGARLHRTGMPGVHELWIARFSADLDVTAVCRRYQAIAAVRTAEPNGYSDFGGGHDDMHLHVRGDRLLFVFEQGGGGEATPSRFRYYEVDTVAETITPRGELAPDEARAARIHRWNVPERFPVGPFADFDAVLEACRHADWWVARHGIEVTGHLLTGADQPMYGEDFDHMERFVRVRDQLRERRREAFDAMLSGLQHGDPAVRAAALRWMRHLSGLDHDADDAGRAAFRRWVDEQLR